MPVPNTSTDTEVTSFVIIKISTNGEYKVAFSLWPSTAIARLQLKVCKCRGRSKI